MHQKEEYGENAYIVLEVKVEKYRSLDDLGELTSEQVDEISTMQLVHSKLLEYCYQYTMAKQTQERLDEIAYTTFITVTSTIIVLAVTSGAGAALSAVKTHSLASVVKNINVFALFKAAGSVVGEALEELYVDPWIEAFFSHKTKEWGWELWSQVFVTTFMESIRETVMGGVPKAAAQVYAQVQAQRMGSSTNQDSMMDMQESSRDLKAQRLSQAITIASSVLSGLMLFAGAIMPGFSSSSFMTGLATALVVGGTIVDDIGEAISSYLYTDPSQRDKPRSKGLLARLRERLINRRATDPRKKPFTISISRISAPRRETIEKVKDMTKSDISLLQRARNWLSEHKTAVAGVVGGLIGLGLVNIFPIVGSILSSLSLPFTVGMVKSESRLLGKSHEISLTEYAKNLIEEFGFIPMGGIKLPDGSNSWEITYDRSWVSKIYDESHSEVNELKYGLEKFGILQQEKHDDRLADNHPNRKSMGNLLKLTKREFLQLLRSSENVINDFYNDKHFTHRDQNLKALKYLLTALKLESLESYRIKSIDDITSLNRHFGGEIDIVYRIIDKDTGLEYHGETFRDLILRIKEHITKYKKGEGGNFHDDILTSLKSGIVTYHSETELLSAFFNNYEVEIWICKDRVEMDALELLNQLYYNRKEGETYLSNLGINNNYNQIYGNGPKHEASIKSAYDLFNAFKQSLSAEEMLVLNDKISDIKYINRRYIISYFNGKNTYLVEGRKITIKATTYNEALRQYTVEFSKKNSYEDSRYLNENGLNEFKKDLIWTLKGPEGRLIGLFYGIGDGLSESYFRHLDKFSEWFRTEMNIDTRPSMSLISETIYKAIMEENYCQIG